MEITLKNKKDGFNEAIFFIHYISHYGLHYHHGASEYAFKPVTLNTPILK